MTTVAYRAGVLAADSLSVIGETRVPERCQKVFYLANGGAVAIGGYYSCLLDFVRWLGTAAEGRDPGERPALGEHDFVVHLTAAGLVEVYEDGADAYRFDGTYMAWGSGADIALGAMFEGASAEKAIKAAAHFNINTGLPVQFFKLKRAK